MRIPHEDEPSLLDLWFDRELVKEQIADMEGPQDETEDSAS